MMSQPKHILVVDDNGDVRDVIVAILESHNFRVSCAASGSLMRDFLQTADPVDCVVLDALMPGEGNISLVLHLKELRLPVVVISGSHDAMERAQEYNLQLLRKPFHAQELYDAVNTALSSGEFGQRDFFLAPFSIVALVHA
jgi:two-component system, OmpR family, response regulator